MADRTRLAQLDGLKRLRKAEAEAASDELRQARAERERTESARDLQREARDAAGADWSRLVGESRFQPQLAAISAQWLLEQERRLAADELGVEIALSRQDLKLASFHEALAREEAVKKTARKARKSMERYVETRHYQQLADSLLWRWCR